MRGSSFFRFTLMFLLLVLAWSGRREQRVAAQERSEDLITEVVLALCPDVQDLIEGDDWLNDLACPVLRSEAEIRERQQACERAYVCLSYLEQELPLPDVLVAVKNLAEYFLFFAGTPENSSFADSESGYVLCLKHSPRMLVDLETASDPAVRKLREKIGLQAPCGFVYLRFYQGRDLMPPCIRAAFGDENTKAVTILSRYIAVLSETTENISDINLQRRTLPKTVSHELVHSYINCCLGIVGWSEVPEWFHEGCAIHLSGSGGTRSIITTTGPSAYTVATVRDPAEYKDYKIVFDYLESAIGQDSLYHLIRRSVENRTVNGILASAGAGSFDGLLANALAWRNRRDNIIWGVVIGVVFVLAALIYGALPKTPKPPSV